MEPLLMACMSPIDLYFLVRGDLFENKFLKPILVGTHQLPIFRFRDGFTSLRQNQQTIDKVIDTLAENKAVMIFAEGSTLDTFGIRPLQKGLGRIAFQTLDKYPDLDLQILPVGVTFSQISHIGSDVLLQVGKPYSVSEFYTPDPKDQPGKVLPMIRKTEERMKELVISESPELPRSDIRNAWKTLTIERKEGYFNKVVKDSDFFKTLSERVKNLKGNEIIASDRNYISGKRQLWSAFLMPLALPAYIFMTFPRAMALRLRKTLVKKVEFRSPITFASAMFLTLLQVIILLIGGLFGLGIIPTLITLAGLTFSGLCYSFVWENYNK